MTSEEDALRAKLSKLEALFRRAGTEGERLAAGAAIDRLHDRIGVKDADPAIELQFSFPDRWSVRLFLAVCRKHGLRPYRYPRQRRTTIVVRAPRQYFDRVIWIEFSRLQSELEIYFEATADHLIRTAMHADGDDSTLEQAQLPGL